MDVLPELWAICPSALTQLEARIRRGPSASPGWNNDAAPSLTERRNAGRIAVINIVGTITQRPTWFSDTSCVQVQAAILAAAADSSVAKIVLNVDSPGGSVAGTQELADTIFKARAAKPIISIANSVAASAAYWIASAAGKMYAAPNSQLGSIGVIWTHIDASGLNEKLGIKPSYITSAGAPHKAEVSSDGPLSDEARQHVQGMVDAIHRDFVSAVARHRGLTASVVQRDFHGGRVVLPPDAKAARMIDGTATLSELMGTPAGSPTTGYTSRATVPTIASAGSDDDLRRRRWRQLQREAKQ